MMDVIIKNLNRIKDNIVEVCYNVAGTTPEDDGGYYIQADGDWSVVNGGFGNEAKDVESVVNGGRDNNANGNISTIIGGKM